MKKKYIKYKSGIALFFSALLVVGMINLLAVKPTYSNTENRELATMPKFSFAALTDGSYISGLSTYLSDTFLGRESLVRFAGKFKSLYGFTGDDTDIIVKPNPTASDQGIAQDTSSAAPAQSGTESDLTSSAAGTSSESAVSSNFHIEDDSALTSKGLVIAGTTAFQLYGYAPKVNERYAAAVSSFAAKYPNVNTMCMVAPLNTEFYLPEKYKKQTANEKESIEKIYSLMSNQVTTIDAYSKLAQHQGEYIYFRTDHHWTQLGAYYGYTAFAEKTGIATPSDITKLRTITYDNFLGSLYLQLKGTAAAEKVAKEPDVLTAYIPDFNYELYYYPKESIEKPASYLGKGTLVAENVTVANKYMCFIHGDQPFERIENLDNQNGKTLLIFKESYANSFVPFVCHDYQTVLVVDPRYFTQSLSKLMSMYEVDDALFLNYIMAPGTTQRVSEIEKTVAG